MEKSALQYGHLGQDPACCDLTCKQIDFHTARPDSSKTKEICTVMCNAHNNLQCLSLAYLKKALCTDWLMTADCPVEAWVTEKADRTIFQLHATGQVKYQDQVWPKRAYLQSPLDSQSLLQGSKEQVCCL